MMSAGRRSCSPSVLRRGGIVYIGVGATRERDHMTRERDHVTRDGKMGRRAGQFKNLQF